MVEVLGGLANNGVAVWVTIGAAALGVGYVWGHGTSPARTRRNGVGAAHRPPGGALPDDPK